jgi:DNA polymerase III alpha subunit
MISKDQERLIIEIERLQEALIADMESALPSIFSSLSDEVASLVANLSMNPDDRAKALRDAINLKRKISDTLVQNSEYQFAVASLLFGFEKMAQITDDYMSLILDGYDRKKDLYNSILRINIDQTKNLLLGAGIRDNFGSAIQEVLKAYISGVGTSADLQKTLRKFIKGILRKIH